MYAQESIDLLRNSGIKFEHHEERGIDVSHPSSTMRSISNRFVGLRLQVQSFGEKLTSSGIVLSDDIVWISFHSGYDFG